MHPSPASKIFPELPSQFCGREAQGWTPKDEGGQTNGTCDVSQFLVGRARNFVYCIRDHATKRAVIIDPHDGSEILVHALSHQGYLLDAIWLTHAHWDHIGSIVPCAEAASDSMGIKIALLAHPLELERLQLSANAPLLISAFDGDAHSSADAHLGATHVKLHHTPGHSPGALCYALRCGSENILLTGDTLFIGDCGRTDLPGGNPRELWESLQRIKLMDDANLILPGHHYSPPLAARLGEQKLHNPALAADRFEEFLALP